MATSSGASAPKKKAPAKKPAAKKTTTAAKAKAEAAALEDAFDASGAGNVPRDATQGSDILPRLFAELLGTYVLMLMGLGTAALAGQMTGGIVPLMVALAFGITVIGLIVAIGRISGAHLNPAVTLGLWAAGRFSGRDVAGYLIVQVFGALSAVATIVFLLDSHESIGRSAEGAPTASELVDGFSIGWGNAVEGGVGSPVGFGLGAGIAVEIIATALLVAIILFATAKAAPKGQAPFTIGLSLTVLIMFAIPFTNGSLNPARATATWALGSEHEFAQLWPWWLAGVVAGLAVGGLFRLFGAEEDLERDDA